MQIKELQPRQGNINIEAEVIEMTEVREFQKFGKPGKVCSAIIKDDSGQCKLSLWNEQIEQIKTGDKIKIIDGYATEWQGQIQVTTGRNGSIEVVGKADSSSEPEKSDEQESPETSDESAEDPTKDAEIEEIE